MSKTIRVAMLMCDVDTNKIASRLRISPETVQNKLKGITDWKVQEGFKMVDLLNTTRGGQLYRFEDLFKRETVFEEKARRGFK